MLKPRILLVSSSLLVLFSCSNVEEAKKVCSCEKLYQDMKSQEISYRLESDMPFLDAKNKVSEDNKGQYDDCAKFHKEMGEDTYFTLSLQCK